MTADGSLGLLLVLIGLFVLVLIISQLRLRRDVRSLVVVGLALRVFGGLAYLYLFDASYGGGDYNLYYRSGLAYAETILHGDWGAIVSPWMMGQWWGTAFTVRLSGLVLSLIGPTLPGAFIVFAMMGYGGILALVLAFTRAFPMADWRGYLFCIILFPSLWFWPAALGKDAVVLCGVGVATLGFVGRGSRKGWLLMVLGVALVFAVRPQVAATLVFALVAGQWLGASRRWSFRNAVQGLVLLAAGVGVVVLASGALEVELFDAQEVEEYLDSRAQHSRIGGSAIERSEGITPWLAPINTLFRPFLWEARGITSLLASLEVLVLWGLAWSRRREIKGFVRSHRRNRLFWMALIFVLVYAAALGMSLSNLGMVARQRVHILPFVFMFIAGVPKRRSYRRGARSLASRDDRSVGTPA